MEKLKLREMQNSEFEETATFSFELFVSELAKSSGKDLEETRSEAGGPPLNRSQNDLWRAIDLDGKKIGYIWIQVYPESRSAFGYEIYLNREYRGKGHGRAVMEEGRKLLKEMNIDTLKACVFKDNKTARSLYDSLGFKIQKLDEKLNQYHLEIEV